MNLNYFYLNNIFYVLKTVDIEIITYIEIIAILFFFFFV